MYSEIGGYRRLGEPGYHQRALVMVNEAWSAY
jgi:hypothetical protein